MKYWLAQFARLLTACTTWHSVSTQNWQPLADLEGDNSHEWLQRDDSGDGKNEPDIVTWVKFGVDTHGRAWSEASDISPQQTDTEGKGSGKSSYELLGLLRRFESTDGLVVHMLEPKYCPMDAANPPMQSLYHESASVLRHDLPLSTAFDRDIFHMGASTRAACMGLIVSPQTRGCAWPVDANSGIPPCVATRNGRSRPSCRRCEANASLTEHLRSQLEGFHRACDRQKAPAWAHGGLICCTPHWEWAFTVQQALHSSAFCSAQREWVFEQFISRFNEVQVTFTISDIDAVVYLEHRHANHERGTRLPRQRDEANTTSANCARALRFRDAVHAARRKAQEEQADDAYVQPAPLMMLRNGHGEHWAHFKTIGPVLQPAEC
mmetsp:Transcript_48661/g.80844  ORF Transcript_48661/g.80844 Transcript_48661/m.80844 type:complete len:379 (+) Transcript_48661:120-1256(+)